MFIESGLSASWTATCASTKMQDLGKIEAAADSGNHEARNLRAGRQSAKDHARSNVVEDHYGRID
jgi:hypothetical protein